MVLPQVPRHLIHDVLALARLLPQQNGIPDIPEEHDHGRVGRQPGTGALLDDTVLNGFEDGGAAHAGKNRFALANLQARCASGDPA